MTDSILQLDYKLLEFVNQTLATSWQDQFFPWITDLHKSPWFAWIVIPILLFCFYRKFSRVGISLFLVLILSLATNDFVGSQVKNHFLRPRPFQNTELHVIQRSPAGSKSFYSNHASNMFTFATYTSAFFPAASIPLFFFASVIAYSRVYNGVHYPTDIFTGALVGIFWGLIFSLTIRRLVLRPEKEKS